MKQYLIYALDYTDNEASERRRNARPAHLENVKKLKSTDNYVIGGAILNNDDLMIGSTMVVQFKTFEELNQWLQNDPYITQKVWDKVDIKPFRVAQI